MESVKPLDVASGKGKLRRTFVKVINMKKQTGVVLEGDKVVRVKKSQQEKVKLGKDDLVKNAANLSESFDKLEEEYEKRLSMEALLAKLFATVSSIKSGYAQLQYAQSPYDPAGIQKADKLVVSELKALSELKQSFLKNQYDPNPDRTLVLAEIQELSSLLKTYEIMGKKLECQLKLKDSEIMFLKEKFEESMNQNKLMEKRLNQSGQLCNPLARNLHLSALNPSHFVTYLHHTVKSIRGFVKLMVQQMEMADWDIEMAVNSIQPQVFYYKQDHKCFAFEHFVCKIMFEAFHLPYFSTELSPQKQQSKEMFFERFTELRSMKAKEHIASRAKSRFSRFCREKYLQLIHPKMEQGLFGHLHQRNQVSAFEFPETNFCVAFLEMAKRVWLLHCLAFSFDPEASIFQVPKGCRFSEVYMKSLTEEAFFSTPENDEEESEPRVAFTVVPGFRIGETSIQCEVYLSRLSQRRPVEVHGDGGTGVLG